MAIEFPEFLRPTFEPCGTLDIRSWSFGAIKRKRDTGASVEDYSAQKNSLYDQRIFGPLHDFECACRKYVGERYRGIICDRCGVKLTTSIVRASRFAHINLPAPIPHPLSPAQSLAALPVLPARAFESQAGAPLVELYESLVDAIAARDASLISGQFEEVVRLTLPAVTWAQEWNLAAVAQFFARGVALRPNDSVEDLINDLANDET